MLVLHKTSPRIVLLQDHDSFREVRDRMLGADLSLAMVRNPWAWYVGVYHAWRPLALEAMRAAGKPESIVPSFGRFVRETILLTGIMARHDIALKPGEVREDILPMAWWEGVQRRLEVGRQTGHLLRACSSDAARLTMNVDCIVDVDAVRSGEGIALVEGILHRAGLRELPIEEILGIHARMMLSEPALPSNWTDFYDDDPQIAELVAYNERYLIDLFGFKPARLLGEKEMAYQPSELALVS